MAEYIACFYVHIERIPGLFTCLWASS